MLGLSGGGFKTWGDSPTYDVARTILLHNVIVTRINHKLVCYDFSGIPAVPDMEA